MLKGFNTPFKSSPEAPSVRPKRPSAVLNGGVIGPQGASDLPQLFMDKAEPAPATEPRSLREALIHPVGAGAAPDPVPATEEMVREMETPPHKYPDPKPKKIFPPRRP